MISKNKRHYQRMSYRAVQRSNKSKRAKLTPENQRWLKSNGYRNVGWDNVIKLYKKIEEFRREEDIQDMSLEELFLEADRIGNKYQTDEERNQFNQKMAQVVGEISEELDKRYPDTVEFIDYSDRSRRNTRKGYRTVRL